MGVYSCMRVYGLECVCEPDFSCRTLCNLVTRRGLTQRSNVLLFIVLATLISLVSSALTAFCTCIALKHDSANSHALATLYGPVSRPINNISGMNGCDSPFLSLNNN
jgi:hypothetical protein